MRLIPILEDKANRRHWVVKILRLVGYIQVIIAILIGYAVGDMYLKPYILIRFNTTYDAADAIGPFIGIVLGFCLGIWLTLAVWGLALVIDDIHAIRMNTSGYMTSNLQDTSYTNQDNPHFVGEVPPQFNYKNKAQ